MNLRVFVLLIVFGCLNDSCYGCQAGYYGLFCSNVCPKFCHDNKCNVTSGKCLSCIKGYYKDYDEHCVQCPERCTACNSNYSCFACNSGFKGQFCQDECSDCKSGTSCDKYTGFCFDNCSEGLSGELCDMKCASKCKSCSRYNHEECISCADDDNGLPCKEECFNRCLKNTCNDSENLCTYGCSSGFWGGETCNQTCLTFCKDIVCNIDCKENDDAERTSSHTLNAHVGLIVGSVIGSVVMIVVMSITVRILVRMYRSKRGNTCCNSADKQQHQDSITLEVCNAGTSNVGVDVTKSPLTQAEIYSRSIPTPDTKDTDQHEETSFDQLLESSPNTFKLEQQEPSKTDKHPTASENTNIQGADTKRNVQDKPINNLITQEWVVEEPTEIAVDAVIEESTQTLNTSKEIDADQEEIEKTPLLPSQHGEIKRNSEVHAPKENQVDNKDSGLTDCESRNPIYEHNYIFTDESKTFTDIMTSSGQSRALIGEESLEFWTRIWEHDIRLIVMLTDLTEEDEAWKPFEDFFLFGSEFDGINVALHSGNICNEPYKSGMFRISKETGKEREIYFYRFIDWSDKRIPGNLESFVKFHAKVKECNISKMVYCSTGWHRCSSYMAFDLLKQGGKTVNLNDVHECLTKLQETGIETTDEQAHLLLEMLTTTKKWKVNNFRRRLITCNRAPKQFST